MQRQRLSFSLSVVSDSLRPHGLQHPRISCPSLSPRVYSDWCPLSEWRHPTISSSVTPFSSCLQSFPASGSFQMSQLCIRWPKYWSFSISPSNETREEQSRNNSAALGQGPDSMSRDTCNNIFESFYRANSPNKWRILAFFIPERRS